VELAPFAVTGLVDGKLDEEEPLFKTSTGKDDMEETFS